MNARMQPPDPAEDPYALLGVSTAAGADEIKAAYFHQVRLHPPEKDPEIFKHIRSAYERLKDPQVRLDTDLLRLEDWPESALPDPDFPPHITLSLEDVRHAARAFTEIERRDFREDFKPVKPPA
jgi:curved DNA-binding protein CbpA